MQKWWGKQCAWLSTKGHWDWVRISIFKNALCISSTMQMQVMCVGAGAYSQVLWTKLHPQGGNTWTMF